MILPYRGLPNNNDYENEMKRLFLSVNLIPQIEDTTQISDQLCSVLQRNQKQIEEYERIVNPFSRYELIYWSRQNQLNFNSLLELICREDGTKYEVVANQDKEYQLEFSTYKGMVDYIDFEESYYPKIDLSKVVELAEEAVQYNIDTEKFGSKRFCNEYLSVSEEKFIYYEDFAQQKSQDVEWFLEAEDTYITLPHGEKILDFFPNDLCIFEFSIADPCASWIPLQVNNPFTEEKSEIIDDLYFHEQFQKEIYYQNSLEEIDNSDMTPQHILRSWSDSRVLCLGFPAPQHWNIKEFSAQFMENIQHEGLSYLKSKIELEEMKKGMQSMDATFSTADLHELPNSDKVEVENNYHSLLNVSNTLAEYQKNFLNLASLLINLPSFWYSEKIFTLKNLLESEKPVSFAEKLDNFVEPFYEEQFEVNSVESEQTIQHPLQKVVEVDVIPETTTKNPLDNMFMDELVNRVDSSVEDVSFSNYLQFVNSIPFSELGIVDQINAHNYRTSIMIEPAQQNPKKRDRDIDPILEETHETLDDFLRAQGLELENSPKVKKQKPNSTDWRLLGCVPTSTQMHILEQIRDVNSLVVAPLEVGTYHIGAFLAVSESQNCCLILASSEEITTLSNFYKQFFGSSQVCVIEKDSLANFLMKEQSTQSCKLVICQPEVVLIIAQQKPHYLHHISLILRFISNIAVSNDAMLHESNRISQILASISQKQIRTYYFCSIPPTDTSTLYQFCKHIGFRKIVVSDMRDGYQYSSIPVDMKDSVNAKFLAFIKKNFEHVLQEADVQVPSIEDVLLFNVSFEKTNPKLPDAIELKHIQQLYRTIYYDSMSIAGNLIKEKHNQLINASRTPILFHIIKDKLEKLIELLNRKKCGKAFLEGYSDHPKLEVLRKFVINHLSSKRNLPIFIVFENNLKIEISNALKDICQQFNTEIVFTSQYNTLQDAKPKLISVNYSQLNEKLFENTKPALIIQYENYGTNSSVESLFQSLIRKSFTILSFELYDSSTRPIASTVTLQDITETCLTWVRNFKFLLGKKDCASIEELKKMENIQIVETAQPYSNQQQKTEITIHSANMRRCIFITDKIVERNQLTEYLQSVFGIRIIERNSSHFSPADIIICPKTCMIIAHFEEDYSIDHYLMDLEGICEKIVLLSQQFEYCYVCLQFNPSLIPINNFCIKYLIELTNLIHDKIVIHIVSSFSEIETGKLINSVACNSTNQWSQEESEQESFLSRLPCLNYASIQTLLAKYNKIKLLLRLSLRELLEQFPTIPKNSLVDLHSLLHGKVEFKSYLHEEHLEELATVVEDLEQEADMEYVLSNSKLEKETPYTYHTVTPQTQDLRQQLLSQYKPSQSNKFQKTSPPKNLQIVKVSPPESKDQQKVDLSKLAQQFHFTPNFHSKPIPSNSNNSSAKAEVSSKKTPAFRYDDSEDDIVIVASRSKKPSNLNASKVSAPQVKSNQKTAYNFERFAYTPKNSKHSSFNNSRGIEKKKRK